jgi:hypothetical protein
MDPRDVPAVRGLFRGTIVLGAPLPFPTVGLERYEALCLDWYVDDGRCGAADGDARARRARRHREDRRAVKSTRSRPRMVTPV